MGIEPCIKKLVVFYRAGLVIVQGQGYFSVRKPSERFETWDDVRCGCFEYWDLN